MLKYHPDLNGSCNSCQWLPSDEASPRGPGAVDVAFLGDALAARERRSPAVFRGPHRLEFLFLLEAFDSVTEQRTAIGGSGGKGSGVLEQSRRRRSPPPRHARAPAGPQTVRPPPSGSLIEKTNQSGRCSNGSWPHVGDPTARRDPRGGRYSKYRPPPAQACARFASRRAGARPASRRRSSMARACRSSFRGPRPEARPSSVRAMASPAG